MRRLLRSWRWRVAVVGHSMEPTLREGDWLLVDPLGEPGQAVRAPAIGDLVVARDQRAPGRWLVKRVTATGSAGRLTLAGDHPAHRDDDVEVEASAILGQPWLRYWPPRRVGRLG
ncbi:MAG TPA: S24/S26 family peptidase [Candidatus Limnocylindrales bacterium]